MRKYCLIFLVSAISFIGYSQEGGEFDQTQVITGDRTLTVQKAFKISEAATPKPIEVNPGDLSYQMIPKRPLLSVEVDTIAPAKVKVREPLDKLYKGYVKAGVGTFATPFVEAYYASDRDRDFSYGAHLRHLSHNDGINRPVAYSGMAQNQINGWAKKIYKKHSLQADLGYQRNRWQYYGFDPQDADIDRGDYRQRFNIFELGSNWRSYYRDSSRVNHRLGLDAYYLSDNFESNEFGVNATADLHSYRGSQYYSLDLGFDLISYKGGALQPFTFLGDSLTRLPAADETNAILHATPKILLRNGDLRAEVGIALYGRFDNKENFHAFPDVEFSYSLFNDIFVPYAGLTGNVERVSYRTLSSKNPWVLSNAPLENRINRYNIFGGFRGSVSSEISFNLSASYQKSDNTSLFVNDTLISQENRFSVIYDDITALTFMGEITYQKEGKWGASFRGQLFSYDTENEAEAWHLPNFEFGLEGHCNLYNKFIIGANVNFIGSRRVKSLLPIPNQEAEDAGFWTVKLDPYLDLGLAIEYKYTSRLSAFIEANNLTATKYDIYYRFPAQRAFILGGVKYSF
ncbi:MAG: hypothetical protein MK086_11740 [Flavobacteriales bacterium]|nr:hypothetical protein [Flavobacteriales bacterium]